MTDNHPLNDDRQDGQEHPLKTRVLDEKGAPIAAPRITGPLDAGLGAPWVVDLHIHDTPISLRMGVGDKIILGRSDVHMDIYPDLDLTPYGGMEKGVSRHHTAVIAERDRLLIVDLKSTNGTFVNGQRLQAGQPYRLRHGDEIHCGEVRIDVAFALEPVHNNVFQEQPWVRMETDDLQVDGQRVLLVEENPHVAESLRALLESVGFTVQVVQEIAGAFYAVTRRMPDVIVLNLSVNEVNGLELSRYIRRVMHNTYVPIVAISDQVDRTHVQEVMNAGVDVFLGKPVGVNKLVRAVAAMVQNDMVNR